MKALGCRWNGDEKAWVAFSPEMAEKAKALVGAAPADWVGRQNTPVGAPGLRQTAPEAPGGSSAPESAEPRRSEMARKDAIVWSAEQQAIFAYAKSGKGHGIVDALAGTGKTFTITHMFPFIPEQHCLYLVFNTKNKEEAKAKILDPRVEIKTHNGLGYMFVRQVWPAAKPDDEVEMDRISQAIGKDTADEVKTQVYRLVGFLKNTYINPTLAEAIDTAEERDIQAAGFEEPENGNWNITNLAKAALKVLELSIEKDPEGRISFNDQVWLPVRLGWVRAWFDFIVVDECQDMNIPQLMMARQACKPGGRVLVVGDPNQAIYNFRGAASDGMDIMRKELNAFSMGLTITRRCGKRIVLEANAFVPHYRAADDAPEGSVERIVETMLPEMCQPGEAVLSRTNAPLMSLCLQLIRRGTPARIQGKDLGKALAGIVRKLRAKSVPHFLQKLDTWKGKQKNRFKNTKRYEQKCEEINDTAATLEAVAEGSASVNEIMTRLERLFSDRDTGPQVVLSSVHKAKGLEWSTVYLLRRTFNRRRPAGSPPPTDKEAREERNIQYVAITRAKTRLVWAEEPRKG